MNLINGILAWVFIPPSEAYGDVFQIFFWGLSRCLVLAIVMVTLLWLGQQTPKIVEVLLNEAQLELDRIWFHHIFGEWPFDSNSDQQLIKLQRKSIQLRLGEMALSIVTQDHDEADIRAKMSRTRDGYRDYAKLLEKLMCDRKKKRAIFARAIKVVSRFMKEIIPLELGSEEQKWADWYRKYLDRVSKLGRESI